MNRSAVPPVDGTGPVIDAPASTSLCLLLAWTHAGGPGRAWHARVLAPSGEVLDFDSPFELVRFLSQGLHGVAGSLPPAAGGLR